MYSVPACIKVSHWNADKANFACNWPPIFFAGELECFKGSFPLSTIEPYMDRVQVLIFAKLMVYPKEERTVMRILPTGKVKWDSTNHQPEYNAFTLLLVVAGQTPPT